MGLCLPVLKKQSWESEFRKYMMKLPIQDKSLMLTKIAAYYDDHPSDILMD